MQDLSTLSAFALNVEKLGIVGILAALAVTFIWLYVKQSKANMEAIKVNAEELEKISVKIRELIDITKESQRQFFDLLMAREKKFRGDS